MLVCQPIQAILLNGFPYRILQKKCENHTIQKLFKRLASILLNLNTPNCATTEYRRSLSINAVQLNSIQSKLVEHAQRFELHSECTHRTLAYLFLSFSCCSIHSEASTVYGSEPLISQFFKVSKKRAAFKCKPQSLVACNTNCVFN